MVKGGGGGDRSSLIAHRSSLTLSSPGIAWLQNLERSPRQSRLPHSVFLGLLLPVWQVGGEGAVRVRDNTSATLPVHLAIVVMVV